MINFWIICGLLIIVALVIILPSLLTKSSLKDLDRKKINRAVYKKKLQELETDRENDLIDQDQYSVAKSDLERSLIDDLEDHKEIVFKRSGKILPIIILLALPAIAVFSYLKLNNGLMSLTPEFKEQMAKQQSGKAPSVEDAIVQLEKKLKEDPKNIEGWSMLGRAYVVSQKYHEAVNAYGKANELSNGADPNILISYGEAKGLAAGNSFDASTMALFSKALKIAPNSERGLWYAGLAAYQLEKYKESVGYLETLLKQVPNDQADVKNALIKYLNDARQKAGMDLVEASPSVEDPKQQVTSSSSAITVNVSLSDAVHKKFDDSDTLFIYARAMNGPKMPLALVKMTAGDLPATVTLDDSVSMMPSMTLSSMEQVEVIARISKSGQAIMQSGDVFDVVISELVP